ncbi:MAG: DUF1566 domain-containing protein [Chitinophagaceae bacterium]|nr:DUF1566 domain-containing protein [Chitinophagaceae bacterium]
MKHFILLFILNVFLLSQTSAQSYGLGDKAQGGIVILSNKKSGIVVSENVLGAMSWGDGKKACEDLVLNGYDDWRLPSEKEITTIYYGLYVKGKTSLPTGFFWLRKENDGIKHLGWCFDFKDGNIYNGHIKSNTNYILPVRSYSLK